MSKKLLKYSGATRLEGSQNLLSISTEFGYFGSSPLQVAVQTSNMQEVFFTSDCPCSYSPQDPTIVSSLIVANDGTRLFLDSGGFWGMLMSTAAMFSSTDLKLKSSIVEIARLHWSQPHVTLVNGRTAAVLSRWGQRTNWL